MIGGQCLSGEFQGFCERGLGLREGTTLQIQPAELTQRGRDVPVTPEHLAPHSHGLLQADGGLLKFGPIVEHHAQVEQGPGDRGMRRQMRFSPAREILPEEGLGFFKLPLLHQHDAQGLGVLKERRVIIREVLA